MKTTTITADDVLETLRTCAGEPERPIPSGSLDDVTFEQLGYDSLALIEAATRLEDQFGVRIPDEDLPLFKTFGQLVDRANG